MKIGTLENPVVIDGTWQVIHDSGELAAAVTDYDITGLDGDVDEEYKLIIRQIGGSATANSLVLTFNDDTGANYGRQYLAGYGATVASGRTTTDTSIQISQVYTTAQNSIIMAKVHIHAKSGYVRTVTLKGIGNTATTTVASVAIVGNSWNNTVDNLIKMTLTASQASGIGIGSRIILMRKVTESNGLKFGDLDVKGKVYGVWQEVSRKEVTGSAIDSHAFTGLDGNTDVIYRLRNRIVGGVATPDSYYLSFNSDTTGSNYGEQSIEASGASIGAAQYANKYVDYNNGAGHLSKSESIIYAKSGYNRVAIINRMTDVNGTTVGGVDLLGFVWNNNIDNIIQIVVTAGTAGSIGVGSVLILEKLVLT